MDVHFYVQRLAVLVLFSICMNPVQAGLVDFDDPAFDMLGGAEVEDPVAEAKVWYDKAVTASAEGRYADARDDLARARALQPLHPLVLGLSGRVELADGEYKAAAGFWRELQQQYPGDASILAALASAELYQGNFAEAARQLNDAAKIDPADLYVRFYQSVLSVHDSGKAAFGNPGTRAIAFFVQTIQSEKTHLQGILNAEQIEMLTRDALNLSAETDAANVLAQVGSQLQEGAAAVAKEDWAKVAEQLASVRAAGVGAVAIEYDLTLAKYKIQPDSGSLSNLALVLRRPGGQNFVGIFALLCLKEGRAAEADQLAGDLVDRLPGNDALLVRAALRRDQDDVAGAWNWLAKIPPEQRASLAPWFEQDLVAVRKLKADPLYESWLK